MLSTSIQADLPEEVLRLPIQGRNLGGALQLGELLGDGVSSPPTIIAFLRHFG